ncbi:MAG: hypothetical protein KUG75_05195, partial [Pseudomonadales bacterium]|nr:hypothetical protein [Pseudomonadales bacterium]
MLEKSRTIALTALFSMVTLLTMGCQSGQTEKSSSEKPASKSSDTSSTVVTTEDLDPKNEAEQTRWPHQVTTDKYTITFYEPQPTDWDNYQELQAWMAISATGEGLDEKLY